MEASKPEALNRTLVELKSFIKPFDKIFNVPLNRTLVELK